MGIIDYVRNAKERLFLKDLTVFDGSTPPPASSTGVLTEWFYSAPYGMPRKMNITELRSFAESSWVQMVESTIMKEVSNIEWKIIPKDAEDEKDYSEFIEEGTKFLNHPNRNGDSWQDLIKPTIKDVMEIDAGVWVKAYGKDGKLKELWPRDGGTFLKDVDIHGIIKNWWQYSWRAPRAVPQKFKEDQIVYFMNNPSTYRLYGWSPLMSIMQVVELLIQATRYNKDFFRNNAIPDILVSIPGANKDQIQAFEANWKTQVAGKPHKMLFYNNEMKAEKLGMSAKDMEFLAGQKWYMHLIFGAYGLSPAEAGFYENINRAAMEGQERITVKNAIKPYLTLFEDRINRNVLPELFGIETSEMPVKFEFFPKDHVQEKVEHDQELADVNAKILAIDEVRRRRGLKPLNSEYSTNPFKAQEQSEEERNERANQMNAIAGNQQSQMGTPGVKPTPVEKPERKPMKSPSISTTTGGATEPGNALVIPTKPGKPIKRRCPKCGDLTYKGKCPRCNSTTFGTKDLKPEEEAEDYADFLQTKIENWEKQVVKAVEVENVAEKSLQYVKKSFGGFLTRLFSTIKVADFRDDIKKYIMKPMKKGLNEAEDEVGLDIEVSERFNNTADFFADQQLNGYTLSDGKKWHGIIGATKELQIKIYKEVREGVIDKNSQEQITNRVKGVFKSAKEGQAVRIARTETNRFINGGKLSGYIDSGVEGKKRWNAIIDDKTSDECKRLNGQTVGLTEKFIDPATSKEYWHPPSLPNCRSTIDFVFED